MEKVKEDGITIDKAIDIMGHYEEYGFISQRIGRDFAIDIMCKYQQIEQIVKQYKKFGNIDLSMQIISGVIADGNDD